MNITLAVTFTGAPDPDDRLAARHGVFLENREITAANAVLAAQTPPGTPLPLLAFSTPAELKASYLTVLGKKATELHLNNIGEAKSETGMNLRFTAAQLDTMRANLVARLNAGESAASLVTDTAA